MVLRLDDDIEDEFDDEDELDDEDDEDDDGDDKEDDDEDEEEPETWQVHHPDVATPFPAKSWPSLDFGFRTA